MTDAPAGGADVERYEQLRSHALDGESCGLRLGLALLERRGMAAWARAWGDAAPTRLAPALASPAAPAPAAVADELVGALASMALARVAAG